MLSSIDIEKKRKALYTIEDIVSAMKAYAGVTIRRTDELVQNVRVYENNLILAMYDLTTHYPGISLRGQNKGKRILVAFGSSQGLCGPFNEKIADTVSRVATSNDILFVIGKRLKLSLELKQTKYEDYCDSVASINGIQSALKDTVSKIMNIYRKEEYYNLTLIFTYVFEKKAEISVKQTLPPDMHKEGAPKPARRGFHGACAGVAGGAGRGRADQCGTGAAPSCRCLLHAECACAARPRRRCGRARRACAPARPGLPAVHRAGHATRARAGGLALASAGGPPGPPQPHPGHARLARAGTAARARTTRAFPRLTLASRQAPTARRRPPFVCPNAVRACARGWRSGVNAFHDIYFFSHRRARPPCRATRPHPLRAGLRTAADRPRHCGGRAPTGRTRAARGGRHRRARRFPGPCRDRPQTAAPAGAGQRRRRLPQDHPGLLGDPQRWLQR